MTAPVPLFHPVPYRSLRLPVLLGLIALALVPVVRAEAPLTLEDAIHLALEKNQQIKVQSFDQPIARANLLAAYGTFDPALNFNRSYTESGIPASADPLVPQQVQSNAYGLAVAGTSPWGLIYSIGGNATSSRTLLGGASSPQDYLSFGGITITQPLLRGFGFGANLLGVRVAKANRAISDWQFRQTVIDTVTNVIYAYTNLALAQQELRIAQRAHDLSASLLDQNRKEFAVGNVSKNDITQAKARVAATVESILIAEQAVNDATNQFRELIGDTTFAVSPEPLAIDSSPIPDLTVHPADDLRDAYNLRPDYQQAQLGLVKYRANEVATKNQLLPQVDFVGSYGYNGLDQSFAVSRRMVGDQENRSYSAGVVVSVPFTFAQGRGNARSARLQLRQAEADLVRLEQDIAVSIAHAAGQIETTRKRVAADRTAYDLAQQVLDAEVKKYRAGTSSTFLVLNYQDQLIGAENNLYVALAAQRNAIALYDHEVGRTLQRYQITLAKN
jgi:outer membrane protein TolC